MYNERSVGVHKDALIDFLARKNHITKESGSYRLLHLSPQLFMKNEELSGVVEALFMSLVHMPKNQEFDAFLAVRVEDRWIAGELYKSTKRPMLFLHPDPDQAGLQFTPGQGDAGYIGRICLLSMVTTDGQWEEDMARRFSRLMNHTKSVTHVFSLIDFHEGAASRLLKKANMRLYSSLTAPEIERQFAATQKGQETRPTDHPPRQRQTGMVRMPVRMPFFKRR